jgi:Eco57I restriction-modification methylase/restriction endonuclease TaqI-like protein
VPQRSRRAPAPGTELGSSVDKVDPAVAPNAAAPVDWRDKLIDSLDQLAGQLPRTCTAPEARIHDEVVLLLVQLCSSALSDERGSSRYLAPIRARLDSPDPESAWAELWALLSGLDREWLEAKVDCELLRQFVFSPSILRGLLSWVSEMARQASLTPDGPVQQFGALHECLLSIRFERLSSAARRTRKSRAWLRPARVLRWEPEIRAKRLQRELALSKHSVDTFGPALARASTRRDVEHALDKLFDARVPGRAEGDWVVQPSSQRRQRGAHYTPWALCVQLVERTLAPIVAALPEPRSRSLLELRLCDPAMGAGAFLVAAGGYLSELLALAWRAEASQQSLLEASAVLATARREVARAVLFGVDKNPMAVSLARLTLSWFAGTAGSTRWLRECLRAGDALIGNACASAVPPEQAQAGSNSLDWPTAFPAVFARENPGFDAVLGNPPWVAYVGRAAQPLAPAVAAYYAANNPAFKRYRTLHGLFVYRSAALLRQGGRLGLILPTSVADLQGYSATRAAHDSLCAVDPELPDWGDDAFAEVFQPAMALLSTRQSGSAREAPAVWPLAHADLGGVARGLLERLRRLPPFPRELFGERGFQTTQDDQAHLRRAAQPVPPFSAALREGADIGEFRALTPQLFADPELLAARLRAPADWQQVAILIRQTARFPIAARADGAAFRNSVLAGFKHPEWSAELLVCLLNSNLMRWFHYTLQRDARQGMPQLKIGHLRALPALPAQAGNVRHRLTALGACLSTRNDGIRSQERAELELAMSEAFGLTNAERELVAAWAVAHPPPVSRRRFPPPAERRPVDLPSGVC